MSELTLFISHNSADKSIAKSLVELCEKALKLPAREIRCTSVDGYRLPVGADTNEQLRREVFVTRAFVGLITPHSVRSTYVLFELGARWGAKKHLAPLLAAGADEASLSGPLSGLNALHLSRREEALQFIQDLSEYLEMKLEPLSSFSGVLDATVAIASVASGELPASDENDSSTKLSFRNNAYWNDATKDGPFCPRCYNAETRIIRLIKQQGMKPWCPNCDKYFGAQ